VYPADDPQCMHFMLQVRVSSQATLSGTCFDFNIKPLRLIVLVRSTAKGGFFSSVSFLVLEKSAEQTEVLYAYSGVIETNSIEL